MGRSRSGVYVSRSPSQIPSSKIKCSTPWVRPPAAGVWSEALRTPDVHPSHDRRGRPSGCIQGRTDSQYGDGTPRPLRPARGSDTDRPVPWTSSPVHLTETDTGAPRPMRCQTSDFSSSHSLDSFRPYDRTAASTWSYSSGCHTLLRQRSST